MIMFSLKSLLIGLSLVTLSSSAFALTSTEQRDYDRLISGDLSQLTMAAQSIVANNISNTQVLDVLAEFVAQNYLSAPDYQLDSIAWACRALGESNSARYRDLLYRVIKSDAHKKVRKHAKKSYKRLPKSHVEQYTIGSINLEQLQALPKKATQSRSIEEQALLDISHGNVLEIKRLAQDYAIRSDASQQVTDTLAEYFAQNYQQARKQQYDTLAWVCKGLARNTDGRYKRLIEDAAQNSSVRALRKHCPAHIKGKGPYYQVGTLNLEEIAKQFN